MRHFLLYLFLFIAVHNAYAGDYNKVITLVTFNELLEDTLKKEIFSIKDGNTSALLNEYKDKGLLTKQYKSNGWWFYIYLSNQITSNSKNQFKTIIRSDTPFIRKISYRHVKVMTFFNELSLSIINKEIVTQFDGQQVICTIKAYISKDYFRKYLHIAIGEGGERADYILFMNRYEWQCVRF